MILINLREWLCGVLGCDVPVSDITPPNYLEEIGFSEVDTILKAEFPDATILLSDNKYNTTTKEELQRFLKNDITDKWQYVSEYMDCDDYSWSVLGRISNPDWGCLPFGYVWTNTSTGSHAVNIFIDNNREVWIIESQTDAVFKCPNDWKPYLISM